MTVINDCYNASPDSIKAALTVLGTTECKRKIAILGDVLEMGDFAQKAHYELGKAVVDNGIDVLITAGENAAYIARGAKDDGMENVISFEKTLETAEYVKNEVRRGDGLLIKASRGMHFEDIFNTICK